MSSFKESFIASGNDYAALSERTCGDKALMIQLMQMFLEDESFSLMSAYMDKGETENAFKAAHSLKGSCGMLGLSGLFEEMKKITDELRHGELERAKELFPRTSAEYEKTAALLGKLIEL